jgi:predicted alpha/beta-fold hydrolase
MLQCFWGTHSTDCDPNIQFNEETIQLPCGGKVGMHWASHITKIPVEEKKAVVIILPGLTASAKEPYVR